eukprot:6851334-Prymnesium_polylepis.1
MPRRRAPPQARLQPTRHELQLVLPQRACTTRGRALVKVVRRPVGRSRAAFTRGRAAARWVAACRLPLGERLC